MRTYSMCVVYVLTDSNEKQWVVCGRVLRTARSSGEGERPVIPTSVNDTQATRPHFTAPAKELHFPYFTPSCGDGI